MSQGGLSGRRTGARVREVEPLLRATRTHEIDATQPIGDVVAELVMIGSESRP
jgi:hypothetical protein